MRISYAARDGFDGFTVRLDDRREVYFRSWHALAGDAEDATLEIVNAINRDASRRNKESK